MSNEEWGSPAHEAYIQRYSSIKNMPEFEDLLTWLRGIQDKNHVDCIYILYPKVDEGLYIYLVDAAYEDDCHPGSFDYFTDLDKKAMKTPEKGLITEVTNKEEKARMWQWNRLRSININACV